MKSSTVTVDSRAYLSGMKNTERGLITRSRIIQVLATKGSVGVAEISTVLPRSKGTIRRHLRRMEDRKIAVRVRKKRSFIWSLSGAGQQSLEESIRS